MYYNQLYFTLLLFQAFLDCSRRNLTSVPYQIWPNVTELDLSENHLNLLRSETQKTLRNLDNLIKLNLSGNDLPLLVKQRFYHFPSLEILDLSGCKLAAIDPGALLNFPRLRKIFLSNNDPQTPMSAVLRKHGWVEVVNGTIHFQPSDRTNELVKIGGSAGRKERHPANGMFCVF